MEKKKILSILLVVLCMFSSIYVTSISAFSATPKMLEIQYTSSNSDVTVKDRIAAGSIGGKTYQFDIDCKGETHNMKPSVTIKYKKSLTSWPTLETTTTADNLDGNHLSVIFTVPTDAKTGDNLDIALGDSTFENTGKIWFANAVLKEVVDGIVTGENLIPDGDFTKTVTTLSNSNKSYWYTSSNIGAVAKIVDLDEKIYEPLPQPNTPKMLELGPRNNTFDWQGLSQEIKIESNTTYKFEIDKKEVGGAELYLKLWLKGTGDFVDVKNLSSDYKLTNVGTKYICTFKTAQTLYSGNNFRVWLCRSDTNLSSNATLYVANITLCKKKNDGTYGSNLLLNGAFDFGSLGDITVTNKKDQLYGWTDIYPDKSDDWFRIYKTLRLSEIPTDFFESNYALKVTNSEGNISLFKTVESEKTYVFSYDRIYKSSAVATPYIIAFTEGGQETVTPTKIKNNEGNTENTTVLFTMPKNLRNNKNLRIGIAFDDKNMEGYFSNFSLKEVDKYSSPVGNNLIDNGISNFKDVDNIVDYNPTTAELVWMKNGIFTTPYEIVMIETGYFDIRKPQVMVLVGKNDWKPTEDVGGKGCMSQTVKVTAGKRYRLSYNAKWVRTGRPGVDKACIEITYNNGSKVLSESPIISNEEYKETYIFTAPANDLTVSIHIDSGYVAGYFSNFSLVEIDSGDAVISDEIIKNGDFAEGNYIGWSSDGLFYLRDFAEMPENFFGKTNPAIPNMIAYSNTDDWTFFSQHFTLKPNTLYEFDLNYNTSYHEEGARPFDAIKMDYYTTDENGNYVKDDNGNYKDEKGSINSTTTNPICREVSSTDLVDGHRTRIIRTAEYIRNHGDGNMYLELYMHKNSVGYWGTVSVYELAEDGKTRVSDNLIINNDFTLGTLGWTLSGGTARYEVTEQPYEGWLSNIPTVTEMIYSNGSASNQTYSATVTVDAYKNYRFKGIKTDMNSEGVTPQVLYRSRNANGEFVAAPVVTFFDSDRFVFEIDFSIPDDAVIEEGKTEIRVQINNGNKGKGYFADLVLVERGKAKNLATEFKFSSENYVKMPYDKSVFRFHYDDSAFDDGDWAGVGTLVEEDSPQQATTENTTGEIKGSVIDEKGEAVSNLTIALNTGVTVKTDTSGEFSFTDLEPGIYSIFIVNSNESKLTAIENVTVKTGVTSIISPFTFAYMEVIDKHDELIEITTEKGINIGIVAGYLFDGNANPLKGQKIYLGNISSQVTKEKGIFQFNDVPPGKYDLYTKLDNGAIYILKRVEVLAGKGSVYKVKLPSEDSSNTLLIILIIVGAVVVLASSTVAVLLILKKRKVKLG